MSDDVFEKEWRAWVVTQPQPENREENKTRCRLFFNIGKGNTDKKLKAERTRLLDELDPLMKAIKAYVELDLRGARFVKEEDKDDEILDEVRVTLDRELTKTYESFELFKLKALRDDCKHDWLTIMDDTGEVFPKDEVNRKCKKCGKVEKALRDGEK